MKFVFTFLFLLCTGASASFAMGAKPTDPPSGPLPAECVVATSRVIGALERKKVTTFQSYYSPGWCLAINGSSTGDCYPAQSGCGVVSTTLSISDEVLQLACEAYAKTQGYLSDPQRPITCEASPWTTLQEGDQYLYPECPQDIETATVTVGITLAPEALKAARCAKLNTCLSAASGDDAILLIEQWQHQFACSSN